MSKSVRLYITLNPNKPKDKVILEYLSSTYNESETIKSILYQCATGRSNKMIIDNSVLYTPDIEEVHNDEKSSEKVIKDESLDDSKIESNKEIMSFFG